MNMKIETERKFIIKKPRADILSELKSYTESEIVQTYLNSRVATHRVRKRSYPSGEVIYTENKKVRISVLSSEEYEREITEGEYLSLLENKERGSVSLMKKRVTFEHLGKTFEVDIYPAWEDTCILEVELESESEKIEMPSFIEVLTEVTGNKDYSNHRMSHAFPPETR